MGRTKGFALAMRIARKAKGMTQEDFSDVSSRTYVSTLERGEKSPTLEKIVQLAQAMRIHPLTLVALAYAGELSDARTQQLLQGIHDEVQNLKSLSGPIGKPMITD